MKNSALMLILCIAAFGCKTNNKAITKKDEINTIYNDTVRIANNEVEYEIIIIEPGFNFWLESIAKPEGYYSQEYMENRNKLYVTSWNQRVLNFNRYDAKLYEMRIDYNSSVDYGYQVNYKLYNYFIYFQLHYKQKLTGFTPRI